MKARFSIAVAVAMLLLFAPRIAGAFCGFYVSGADAKLFADATQVVLMREGTRTVLSMQNDYQGPPRDFAMVVPVPVVLQKENVKTLPRAIFEKVDALSAPRLVEYWEQNPCPAPGDGDLKLGFGGGPVQGAPGAGLAGIGGGTKSTVKIEAQFEVGEYEILILSAQDSGGLDGWLRAHGYKIPENAEPALRPYVQAGSKFFVAKVNVAKVKFEDGRAQLSPLRFHYDSETFTLPVRLGMLNSSGTQDLVVQVLAPNDQRYTVANYPAVTIPTNLDVAESARKSFPAFYAALFDKTLDKTPGAVVTEYAWNADSCDPCPGSVQGLTMDDLASLGADVLPSAKRGVPDSPASDREGSRANAMLGPITASAGMDQDVLARVGAALRGRMRSCYQTGLNVDPSMSGKLTVKVDIDALGEVSASSPLSNTGLSPAVAACVAGVLRRATFKGPKGSAVFTVTFAPADAPPPVKPAPPPLPPEALLSIGRGFVLTRLHARYARGALADDLVFKVAGKIVGGRESRSAGGELETGALPANDNAFQARYAIRHGWTGPIACDKPQRGNWGGPWPDAGAIDQGAAAATKPAYAPRGGATLASFVPGGVPELAIAGALPPTPLTASTAPVATMEGDGGAAPPRQASRCGCSVIGSEPCDLSIAGGLAAIALAIGVRRRKR